MSEEDEVKSENVEASQPSRSRTLLWLGLGLLVYVVIQWAMPKMGVSS